MAFSSETPYERMEETKDYFEKIGMKVPELFILPETLT